MQIATLPLVIFLSGLALPFVVLMIAAADTPKGENDRKE